MLPQGLTAKYEILGTLGSGASSTVLDARDRVIGRRVAIKLINRSTPGDAEADEAFARFRREAQAAGRLDHPKIVAVYEFGEEASAAWIVMEYVDGGSLKALLDRGDRVTVGEAARIGTEVLGALAFSHDAGVVHRDIKPANILLTLDGRIKLADFGIARIESSTMTQVGTVMGTPSYMAPEQVRGEPTDRRTDIWAVGVVLYQLLTGEKPFEGGLAMVSHRILTTDPVAPSHLSVLVPHALDAVVARALSKRPDLRYDNARAFAAAITEALALADERTCIATPSERRSPAASPAPVPATPSTQESGRVLLLAGGGVAALVAVSGFVMFGSGSPPPASQSSSLAQPPAVAAQVAPPATPLSVLPSMPHSEGPTAPAANAVVQAPDTPPPPPANPTPPATAQAPAPISQAAGLAAPPRPAGSTPIDPSLAQPGVPAVPSAPDFARPMSEPPQALALARPAPPPGPTPRPDPPAAIREVLDSLSCGQVQVAEEGGAFRLTGIVPRGSDRNLVAALQQRGVERNALRLDFRSFDGPFCEVLDMLRPFQAGDAGGVQVGLVGRSPLIKGSLLRLDAGLPDWGTHLAVDYVMSSGQVAHLVRLDGQRPSTRFRLGEPSESFTGWEVDEPFGTDLVVAIASDGPLYTFLRPEVEPLNDFMAALSGALRAARQDGRRVSARVLLIDTAAR